MAYRVLFCSDALLIDGVTSYILHVGTALKRAGYDVAVLGRWAGTGFQSRFREEGIKVIQCPSPTVGNLWFDRKAREFDPDVIMTDSRRSFPLATRLKKLLDKPVVTYFLDHLEKTDRPGRDLASLVRWSDLWAGAEEPILDTLRSASKDVKVCKLPRPLDTAVKPTPLPPKDPFSIVCFGRLSGYKTPGMMYLLDHIDELVEAIPSAKVTVVGGGGWRLMKFRVMAARINRRLDRSCVEVVGTQPDPRPWIERANLVCAASTSAAEAILSNRHTICFSTQWMGYATIDNIGEMLRLYFAERGGTANFRENPEALKSIIPEIIQVYKNYEKLSAETPILAKKLGTYFTQRETVADFNCIVNKLNDQRTDSLSRSS